LTSEKTKYAVQIDQGALDHKGNIGSGPESKSFYQKWDIVYVDSMDPSLSVEADDKHDDHHDKKPKSNKRSISVA
jgi:hypothetical protein